MATAVKTFWSVADADGDKQLTKDEFFNAMASALADPEALSAMLEAARDEAEEGAGLSAAAASEVRNPRGPFLYFCESCLGLKPVLLEELTGVLTPSEDVAAPRSPARGCFTVKFALPNNSALILIFFFQWLQARVAEGTLLFELLDLNRDGTLTRMEVARAVVTGRSRRQRRSGGCSCTGAGPACSLPRQNTRCCPSRRPCC